MFGKIINAPQKIPQNERVSVLDHINVLFIMKGKYSHEAEWEVRDILAPQRFQLWFPLIKGCVLVYLTVDG